MSKPEPKAEQSRTGGVKPMSIAGRMVFEKERLDGMTDEDRAWRRKWLNDQVLTPREPILIRKDHPDLMNPIRRFYRKPLDVICNALPIRNDTARYFLRYYTGKIFIGLGVIYGTFYYFKYNGHTWESHAGWRVVESRTAVYPGDYGYPSLQTKTRPDEYFDKGFQQSIFGCNKKGTTRNAAEI